MLLDLLKELDNKKSFIAIFENVVNHLIFTPARNIFSPSEGQFPYPSPLLVIFTTGDMNVLEEFKQPFMRPHGYSVSLDSLSGEDVASLIDQRWKQIQNNTHTYHPFDEQAIKNVFDIHKYPIRRALDALEFILQEKVEQVRDSKDSWPHDSLKIKSEDIYLNFIKFNKTS